MTDEPTIDGRRREELYREATEIAPYYTEEWKPGSDDPGTALVRLFAELAEEVVERLDHVPEKHRVSFFDTLGFTRDPSQPATAPVTFEIADGVDGNVSIPAGTEATATAAGDRPERTFRVAASDAFEAAPANVTAAYSVDPETDAIFEHWSALTADAETTLFDGVDRQAHVLYVGHPERLAVTPSENDDESASSTAIQVSIETNVSAELLRDTLVWEYYGEREVDGETVEGWHAFQGAAGRWPAVPSESVSSELVVESTIRFLEGQGVELTAADARAIERQLLMQASFQGEFASFATVRSDGGRTATPASRDSGGRAAKRAERLVREYVQTESATAESTRVDERSPTAETLSLHLDGTPTETAVNGIESRWIRARVPDWYTEGDPFDIVIGSTGDAETPLPVRVGPERHEAAMPPDTLLANDVELSASGDESDGGGVLPLGKTPRPQDAFYVASSEVLSKPGSKVEIVFEPPAVEPDSENTQEVVMASFEVEREGKAERRTRNGGNDDVDPDVRWEYWDGSAWSRLDVLTDTTAELTRPDHGGQPRSITFRVPDDLEETSVSGHDGHWVRARLVGGGYGRVVARQRPDDSWVSEHEVTPPRVGSVALRYREEDLSKPAAHIVTENNLAYSADLAGRSRFAPFVRVPETEQTLYVGFDGPLDDGPINLFFSLADTQYPDGFHSRVRWEYRDGTNWREVSVRDGTEGLTERGIVGLTFPKRTERFDRFGRSDHWLRARVTGTAFDDADADADATSAADDAEAESTSCCGREPCGTTVETAPPAGIPQNTRPVVDGLYHNVTWLRNVRRIGDEILGSSTGDQNQQFGVANPPVTEIAVWVDERRTLSEGQRETLQAEQPDRVNSETGPEGDLQSVWVRWEQVANFLESAPDDRHYVLTQATGELAFGDGKRGRIPPRGTDNVKATYETGGGAAGNVDAGAISELKSGISHVDAVTNPVAADGGADVESTAGVLDRAPKELRDRDRAVTEADFERIADDASRRLARTRCLSGMNRAGEHESGWVTMLIVPDSPREKPVPSVTLREQVHAHVSDRAPATLIGAPDQLVVRGPSYVGVSVEADLVTTGVGSVSTLEETAEAAVTSFLHPLTGGDDGTGWEFGDGPCLSDLYALLERIDGVDHVSDLELRFHGSGTPVTIREGDEEPSMSADALVHSATHEITALVAGTGDGAGNGGDA